MPAEERYEYDGPRVTETASGTTAADNHQSGNFAYVIAAIALAVSLLLGKGVGALFEMAGDLILSDYGSEDYYEYHYYGDTVDDSPMDVYNDDDYYGLLGKPDMGVWR